MWETIVEFADVKDKFRLAAQHGRWDNKQNRKFTSKAYEWRHDGGSWSGQSSAKTVHYLDHGYFAPEFTTHALASKPRLKRRAMWSEESGDVCVSRLLGGADDIYLTTGPREGRPGLTLNCEFGFSAAVPAKTIAKYGAWITSLIAALEADGYDLTVTIDFIVTRLFPRRKGKGTREREAVRILVKKSNEKSDFTTWSALFSPGGYRHLMFCAVGCAGDNENLEPSSSLGHCVPSNWNITKSDNTITITCNNRNGGECESALTSAAQREGILP